MENKILAVGPTTQNNTAVNGQSMMFQLFVDEVIRRNLKIEVLDIGKSLINNKASRVSGKFSIIKMLDYCIILIRFFFILLFNPNQTIYITTAQSKVGFIRDYFIIRIASLFKCKIIAHQFGANYAGFFNSQSKSLQNKIKNTLVLADFIVVEGDFTKAQFDFLPNFQTKVISIPNGLPEKIDSTKISAKSINTNQPIKLIYLSNLIESKGFWDVLEATNILINKENINVEIVFSGKFLDSVDDTKFPNAIEARKSFFDYIETNKLQNNVVHLDGLYGMQKAEHFTKAHFFLLPSYYINEGQPVSVLEALAYGCVPIVTNYRLIPSMVNKENGFFVNPESPLEIADIIKNLSNNTQLYNHFSQNAINYYLDNFTAEKYTEKLISLF